MILYFPKRKKRNNIIKFSTRGLPPLSIFGNMDLKPSWQNMGRWQQPIMNTIRKRALSVKLCAALFQEERLISLKVEIYKYINSILLRYISDRNLDQRIIYPVVMGKSLIESGDYGAVAVESVYECLQM